MHLSIGTKLPSALFVLLFLIVLSIAGFFAQGPQSSPTPSPEVSPSTSPTPTPTRSPSPTPLPGAQNFHQWGSVTVFSGLPSDSVRAIAQTADGVMWFGTDNGLARFDGRRIQKIQLGVSDASNAVLALEFDGKAALYVGTRAGAFVYAQNRFEPIVGTESYAITSILVWDRAYFGTETGFVLRDKWNEANRVFESEPVFPKAVRGSDGAPVAITALITNGERVIAGTNGSGFFGVGAGGPEQIGGPSGPPVANALLQDRGGVLWLGSDATRSVSGLFSINSDHKATRITAPTGNVVSLEADESDVWAGTERAGLFHIVASKLKKTYTFENTSGGLRSNNIFTLFTDREGVLWIGTNRGVSRFDRSGASQETVSDSPNGNFIRCLFRSSDRTLYAGSNRGLFVKSGDEWKQLPAFGNRAIFSITENASKKPVVETDPVSRRSFASAGSTWFARDDGVFRESEGRSEKIIEAEDVREVYVAGDRVWAATTTRGLLHARNDARFGWLISAIGFEQGLPSDKAFAILPTDEGLLIATNRGVVTYRPSTVAPSLIATRILSQRIHDLAELGSTIELEYPQDSLLVEVAGQSSRTFPEEFQYAYVLTNSKGEEIDKRVSNAPGYVPKDLTPGDYAIEAIAFNRDLLASEPLIIRFSVAKAPFPRTATALGLLLVLALFGLAWAFIAHRRVSIRNRELAAARLDLANEAERERRRIARDLHDQTLADLRSLMLRSDNAKAQIPGFREEIEAISGEVRRICEDLSPSVLENVGLVAALEFLLKHTIENHRFTAVENLDERLEFPMHVQLQVYRIAQEVLTNIKTHSDADSVEMELDDSDDAFIMSIRDNGGNFMPGDATHSGRGIANIKARASMIGATAGWAERGKGGNRFSLRIPK